MNKILGFLFSVAVIATCGFMMGVTAFRGNYAATFLFGLAGYVQLRVFLFWRQYLAEEALEGRQGEGTDRLEGDEEAEEGEDADGADGPERPESQEARDLEAEPEPSREEGMEKNARPTLLRDGMTSQRMDWTKRTREN